MIDPKSPPSRFTRLLKKIFGTKTRFIAVGGPLAVFGMLGSHEVAIRYFPEVSCTVCHEMGDPVKKWREAGVAKHHSNCVDCHFDAGLQRIWEVNKRAAEFAVEHFRRDPDQPIKPPEEPLFLEEDKDPGYYSLVPNSRCYQCHEAKNHKPSDMQKVHSKLVDDISKKPCKDCHNHQMRNGQKFYEQILTQPTAAGVAGEPKNG